MGYNPQEYLENTIKTMGTLPNGPLNIVYRWVRSTSDLWLVAPTAVKNGEAVKILRISFTFAMNECRWVHCFCQWPIKKLLYLLKTPPNTGCSIHESCRFSKEYGVIFLLRSVVFPVLDRLHFITYCRRWSSNCRRHGSYLVTCLTMYPCLKQKPWTKWTNKYMR